MLVGWMRRIRVQPRVVLAAKTAFAASVAWFLAPLIPLADADYSYYAPLGAVISMYPTLVRSVRTGVQTLTGLALGAGVAFAALAISGPRVVGIALVVGVGVLLAGVRALGAGREWVPITALFVLLIGGPDADNYSINYLVHMVLGVVVGVLVNLLIAPPLFLGTAENRLDSLRDLVADHLRDLAQWVRRNAAGEEGWSASMAGLEETGRNVREAVQQADESRRGNPRGRGAVREVDTHYRRLRALERSLFFTRDLTDALGGFEPDDDERAPDPARNVPDSVRAPLAGAIDRVADLVGGRLSGEGARDTLVAAETALSGLQSAVDEYAGGRPSTVADLVAATVCLRRIVDAARPFVA
jgi:uncharacterized membrane protein YgaE (UPF0421/DUF939 family)